MSKLLFKFSHFPLRCFFFFYYLSFFKTNILFFSFEIFTGKSNELIFYLFCFFNFLYLLFKEAQMRRDLASKAFYLFYVFFCLFKFSSTFFFFVVIDLDAERIFDHFAALFRI